MEMVPLHVVRSDKVDFPLRRSVLENFRPKRWALLPLALACAAAVLMAAEEAAAQNNSSNWWPFSHSNAAPPPVQADDPIALKSKHEAGAELYVAVADLYARSGKLTEAEGQYKQAIAKFPDDLRVLRGYALLKDQMHEPDEALKLYQKAEEKHPEQPSVYNDLAMHYARLGMVRDAIEAARHAVTLSPREPRYRNNLAALFVEAGMPKEAFNELHAIYD